MVNGIAIKDVDNKLQSLEGEEVIPISTGANEPEVVEVDTLKEYINADIDTALEGKQDVINDLATIRSGAALGATALQSYTESDPTVHEWAKAAQKPSYSYSEITGKPTLSAVATSGSYNDLTNKPTIPTIPTNVSAFTNDVGYLTEHQDISGKANSDDLATVAFSGDYEDLENTPTIPDVPEWAMSSTKPSYTVSEINGAQEELESGVNIKTINGTSVLGSGNITIQGGGGDVNVIESITFNGSAVPVDASKNAAITYTETEPDFNGSVAATITSADITSWNGKSTFSGSYNDLTDKPTLFSGDYNDLSNKPTIPSAQVNSDWNASSGVAQILNKPTIPTVPTALSSFTDDLGSSPTHTHSQYLTSHQDISGKANSADLATVATSGSYTDLDDKPTIPTVPSNIVTGTSSSYTIWVGTQAQYEDISTKDTTTIYLITES